MRPLEVVAAETGNQLDDRFNYTARYDLTRSLAALVGHDWLRLTGTDHECQGRLWSSLGAVGVFTAALFPPSTRWTKKAHMP